MVKLIGKYLEYSLTVRQDPVYLNLSLTDIYLIGSYRLLNSWSAFSPSPR